MGEKLVRVLFISLIMFFVLHILMNFLLPKNEIVNDNKINILTKSNYTVPANIKIDIVNNTKTNFLFNTCTDLTIKKSSKVIPITDCRDILLNPSEKTSLKDETKKSIDLSEDFEEFNNEGEYIITLKKDNIDEYQIFKVNYRGFFGKIFIFVFYEPIYNLIAFLLTITAYSLGWSIIIVTIIIRLILLYPQHKMMISQRKMQKIQPKIAALKDKHKGNNQQMGLELMALYKKENVSPLGSCGMMLIQMPIIIVLYNIILGIQDSSNLYYLYSFVVPYEVENIKSMFFSLNLYGVGGLQGIILAMSIGILQFIQIKLSIIFNKKDVNTNLPKKKKDPNDIASMMPDPELLSKFMLYGLPLMIGIASYSLFSGVGLYWGISTIFMIIQQIIVNSIIKVKKS